MELRNFRWKFIDFRCEYPFKHCTYLENYWTYIKKVAFNGKKSYFSNETIPILVQMIFELHDHEKHGHADDLVKILF